MKRQFKVRFHLGNGENYMKWQIRDNEGNVNYYNPEEVSLKLEDCFLRNQLGTSTKIFKGKIKKTVCGWVECSNVVIREAQEVKGVHLKYNPKKSPHWWLNDEIVNGQSFSEIVSSNKSLYV